MNTDYIIVQAGGRGSRLDYLTKNKPKPLVPVENRPMLFHLFEKYPEKRFVIIGDYKIGVLREYLRTFARVKYIVVDAGGCKGTCAGMGKALSFIPQGKSFALIWSDLILPHDFALPDDKKNHVGLSKCFRCRWKYEEGVFSEEPSVEFGVAGLFVFPDKGILKDVPAEGEFVAWLKEKGAEFEELPLYNTREIGLLEEYKKMEFKRCRPFNKMTEQNGFLIKEGLDEQGKYIAEKEKNWYKHVQNIPFNKTPHIDSFEPLTMEKIDGKNVFEYQFTLAEKKSVLKKLAGALRELHALGGMEPDFFSVQEAYVTKTYTRLDKVKNLIPLSNEFHITVNGRRCRNVFFHKEELEAKMRRFQPDKFRLIHGDCTFSNIMLRNGEEPVLIDPRGYFGFTDLYGDPAYDWAKLYYSIKGNYDKFNAKQFRLAINEEDVELAVDSNNWEDVEDEFFRLVGDEVTREQIKLIHAIIWLSLTTYAWEDYDSICGAFYNGLYYLEEVL